MPPKKVAVKQTTKAQKQIDDFIGQSEMEPGQEANLIRSELQKERIKELTEKFYDAKNP